MNFNHNKIAIRSTNKAYLNSSIVLANKLNKSRSLLKNSVLRCAMKENNNELARALAFRESEISEIRKDNVRLLRENYDLMHSGPYRAYNFNSFMTKLGDLTDVAISLFNNVCKLSDDLVELKSHPFMTGEGSHNETTNQQFNTTNAESIPSPFAPKDKIPRSPLNSLDEGSELDLDKISLLASQIVFMKSQANNSIHNLSTNIDASSTQRPTATKLDLSHKNTVLPMSPLNHDDLLTSKKSKITVRRGAHKKENNCDVIKKKRIKISEENDPMFSSKVAPKSKQRKKKILANKTEKKEKNKEEYRKHKEKDAYHLSINETINTTILPSSLNEFKNQQKVSDKIDLVKEIKQLEPVKDHNEEKIMPEIEKIVVSNKKSLHEVPLEEDVIKVPKLNVRKTKEKVKKSAIVKHTEPKEVTRDGDRRRQKSHNLLLDQKPINFNDDDDDFILSKSTDKSKKKNVLDDSLLEIDQGDQDNVHTNADKENEANNLIKKPKTKLVAGSKKKHKESVVVTEEIIPPEIVVDKKRKRKNKPEIEDNAKVARKQSNVSLIIANINANIDENPNVAEKVKGRAKKKKNIVD